MHFLKLKKMNIREIRQMYYTPESIVHPAKMDISLANWILDEYVKDGDVVLDPMCGIGTTLVEGMRKYPDSVFIGVELEEKFVELARGNIGKTKMHSATDLFKPKTATAFVVKRDARELSKIPIEYVDKADGRTKITSLVGADAIVTSPSYGGAEIVDNSKSVGKWGIRDRKRLAADTFKSKENLGMMKEYGKVDTIVSSPPYAESLQGESENGKKHAEKLEQLTKQNPNRKWKRRTELTPGRELHWGVMGHGYSKSPLNIGNLKHGQIDKIVTSPPYAHESTAAPKDEYTGHGKEVPYTEGNYMPWETRKGGNIGKRKLFKRIPCPEEEADRHDERPERKGTPWEWTKGVKIEMGDIEWEGEKLDRSESYLSAMLKVYAECNQVLKLGGLMILVTKNFVRNGEQVRLDEDTIRLCEVCGFELVKRHYRKLRGESFWRILYRRKWEKEHPDEPCPVPQWEDILVFRKVNNDAMPF